MTSSALTRALRSASSSSIESLRRFLDWLDDSTTGDVVGLFGLVALLVGSLFIGAVLS